MFDLDLFVVGGGSGGVRAARMAAAEGFRVGLAEEYRLGGTCVIRGCVPKKLMVNAADFSDSFADSRGFGWDHDGARFDWQRFRRSKDDEIARLERIYRTNLEVSGVTIHDQRGRLLDAHTVELADGTRKSAKYILIATGGRPHVPDIPGSELAITSNEIFDLERLPEHVLIVGGGYIACEFSGIFNGLGCKVTQFYRGKQILRGFDDDIRSHVSDAMVARGVDLELRTNVTAIRTERGRLEVTDAEGAGTVVDAVVYATGRKPNTRGLGLEECGVALGGNGSVVVDSHSQTAVPSIFAVGDVTDRLNLTPVAIREGAAFVETIFRSNPTEADHHDVPTAVFTRPEIGTVGLTEAEASGKTAIDVYITRFRPLSARIAGREESTMMKLIVDKNTTNVLGVHIVGPGAAEMIQIAGIAVKMRATKDDFDRTVAVHPTAAEELVTMREPTRTA